MDLWVVAAAAGAGYLAKYWQNIFRDKESSSGFTSGRSSVSQSAIQHNSDRTCPIGNSFPSKTANLYFSENDNENYSDGRLAKKSRRDGATTEVISTSMLDHGKQVENHKDHNMPSSSVVPPEFKNYENYEYENGGRLGSDLNDIPEYHIWEMGASHSPRRGRNSLRSKRLHLQFIKPRSSLDSCVVAQMHREHAEMEDYFLTPLASPCTQTLRPFFVTDGRRLIGRASGDFREGWQRDGDPKVGDGVVGVPYLPRIGPTDDPKQKINKRKNQMGKTGNNSTLVQFDSRDGYPSGQFLFCLGISIGIMYTIIAQKREVEKLKESLQQSENLVQDLQEELEMKDSLTVKELAIDDSSQDAHEISFVDKELNMLSSQVDTSVLMKCTDDESVSHKEVESMSKIEAELEAELERLELSMNATTLKGKLSDTVKLEHEFDEDIIADLVHGELRADVVRRKSSSEPTPDRGSSSTSTTQSARYCVSPRELSLRLHEVIQSRLKERIMELEAELAKVQKKVQHLESERVNSWRDVWNGESSSNPGTPIVVEAYSPVTQPVVMNLSGDALDAYNDAFEELSKIKVSQNEDPIPVNGHKDDQLAAHQVSNGKQNGNRDFNMTGPAITGDEPMPDGRVQIPFDEGSPNRNEDNDDDDDLLLIQQIVEKARQGSPAILRAKRALVYLQREE